MSVFPISQPIVVITGATGGLGTELVRAYIRAGCLVFGIYHSSEIQACSLMTKWPEQVRMVRADIRCRCQLEDAAQKLRLLWSRVDILIHNAGIMHDALLIRQREEQWDDVMSVNLTGAFHALRIFAAFMDKGGHVVNISSYSGLKGKRGQAAYSASKAALFGLTRTAAAEFGQLGVCVNAVLPGYLPLGMGPKAAEAALEAQSDSMLGRLSDPVEVAEFICHLTRMRSVTGQIFCLDSRII